MLDLLLIIIRRFFPALIENIKNIIDPVDSRLKKLDLHISAGILAAVCHIESLRAMNQALDAPAAASAAAALLDLDPNSAGICSSAPRL
ncbi:MAG: hypothetical protein LBU32_07555 [Clostridiales bacterium]|nr:hypothetical protein [Clostridiales bacterium]